MRESAVAWPERAAGEVLRLSHAVRPLGAGRGAGAVIAVSVDLGDALVPEGAHAGAQAGTQAMLRAGAAFLLDALDGAVGPGELARTIGCLAVFLAAAPGASAEVAIGAGRGAGRDAAGAARVRRPAFEIEPTGFGAAHVLHESAALGLYVLEVAPGAAIPAHFHRVMQEAELVLDPGLLLQGEAVAAGAAFVWPAGCVHAYVNPGPAPGRILCIDRPKFIPDDEVVVAGPVELAPARPARSYRI